MLRNASKIYFGLDGAVNTCQKIPQLVAISDKLPTKSKVWGHWSLGCNELTAFGARYFLKYKPAAIINKNTSGNITNEIIQWRIDTNPSKVWSMNIIKDCSPNMESWEDLDMAIVKLDFVSDGLNTFVKGC